MVDSSVTNWIGRLKAGDAAAANPLWNVYFRRLVCLARNRLPRASRQAADEEDVALSAFNSFCAGAARGRFPQLANRQTLWPLLATLTRNKCVDLIRREIRQKRGGDRERDDALNNIVSRASSPESAAQLADQVSWLMTRLAAAGDPDLRTIALARLNGNRPAEIAAWLGCSRRSVERKLSMIARLWSSGEST